MESIKRVKNTKATRNDVFQGEAAMKRCSVMIFMFFFAAGFISALPRPAMGLESLYDELSQKKIVKVYVEDVKDSTDAKKIDLQELKGALESALSTRMTINFKVVSVKTEADIAILCDITEFLWREETPMGMITGVSAGLLDVLGKDNFARVQAKVTIIDVKNGDKAIWEDTLQATITSEEMPQPDSISILNDELVKVIMRDCFSKGKAGRR